MKWDLPSPVGIWPHSMGRNFTGLYRRRGEIRRDNIKAGIAASKPKPSM